MAEIAVYELKEWAIVENPTEGYGNQLRDYDIGIVVAQRIINKRNNLGGFTCLNQESNPPELAGVHRRRGGAKP